MPRPAMLAAALAPALDAPRAEPRPQEWERFTRRDWAALAAGTPPALTEAEFAALCGVSEPVSFAEVTETLTPLACLINLEVAAARRLAADKAAFLDRAAEHRPFIVAIAGSVAVGKSTLARTLRFLLARWPDHPRVDLVTTDGFLHPNRVLEQRGLMHRKGFPESYDLRRMIRLLADAKSGLEVQAPVYSHLAYDIVPGERQSVRRPDILIFEGLNVLQTTAASVVASDFFDFSIYVDAETADIEAWYLERFLLLQRTAFRDPASYFHRYRDLPRAEAEAMARDIWRRINLVNLHRNVAPTRERARVLLSKRSDHAVGEVLLRRH